jgi:hypothetical protein
MVLNSPHVLRWCKPPPGLLFAYVASGSLMSWRGKSADVDTKWLTSAALIGFMQSH